MSVKRIVIKDTKRNQLIASLKSAALSSDNLLHHEAFDNSLQPNILSTVKAGKIILVNRAACKLLGYSKKELLTKPRSAIFDIKEHGFKMMLKQRMAEGHSKAAVIVIQKNGRLLPCEITSAVYMGMDGIEKAITTIADMSKNILEQKKIDVKKEKEVAHNIFLAKSQQQNMDARRERIVAANIVQAKAKSDARVEENNEWKEYTGKTSYDVMWDWELATGRIYVGDSIEEVFGYNVPGNTVYFTDFKRCLFWEERSFVERKLLKTIASRKKSWDDSYKFKRRDGSIAATTSRASIIRDEKGNAIRLIGAIQDVSRLQEMDKKLKEQATIHEEDNEIFLLATKLTFDVIWDWNILTNELFIGEGFEELFGYTIKNNTGFITDWVNHLHFEDKDAVVNGLQRAIASPATNWEHVYRFNRADGSVAKVFNRAGLIRNAEGKAYRMIGAMQDISKQKALEDKLEQEAKLKVTQISNATKDARNNERSNIGKELHDNINQLLGASKMYLDVARQGGEDSEICLSRSSEYILTAIEEIRKLTKGLISGIIESLGLCEAIDNIVHDTMEVNPIKISCSFKSFKEDSVNDKFKQDVFRIVQEQLNNILKHSKATTTTIRLVQNKKLIILSISDNGIGFDITKKPEGIGIVNIKSRALSYNGEANFVSHTGRGCMLSITFPITETILKNPK